MADEQVRLRPRRHRRQPLRQLQLSKPGGAVQLARSCSRGDRGPVSRFMADGARAVPGERWAHVGELMGTDNDLVPGFSRPRESGN